MAQVGSPLAAAPRREFRCRRSPWEGVLRRLWAVGSEAGRGISQASVCSGCLGLGPAGKLWEEMGPRVRMTRRGGSPVRAAGAGGSPACPPGAPNQPSVQSLVQV